MENTSCILCQNSDFDSFAEGNDYEYWTSDQTFYFVKCSGCGHVYLNPRPLRTSADKIYPSDYYTMTGRHTSSNSKLIASMKDFVIQRRLSFCKDILKSEAKILEIGCGDCSLLITLKKRYPTASVAGVDISIPKESKDQCTKLGILLFESSIEETELKENYYNIVIMNQIIEHLWDPVLVIKKIHAALCSGGIISIETPNLDGYDRRFFAKSFWGGYYFPRHFNLFSFNTLSSLLKKIGFTSIQQRPLLAVVIWTFSFKAIFCQTRDKKESFAARFFSDKNPLCLAIFTIVDLIAIVLGATTSNQKTIACKA